jgi:hypothetical protein
VRIAGHGIAIDAPAGWEARIFKRDGAAPVLHAATFALHEKDGDFGAAATGRMRQGDIFLALVQYLPDQALQPGQGLFAGKRPTALAARELTSFQLQVTRQGHLGCQRFYTERGRPFCLYVVLAPTAHGPKPLLSRLNGVLRTLSADP